MSTTVHFSCEIEDYVLLGNLKCKLWPLGGIHNPKLNVHIAVQRHCSVILLYPKVTNAFDMVSELNWLLLAEISFKTTTFRLLLLPLGLLLYDNIVQSGGRQRVWRVACIFMSDFCL